MFFKISALKNFANFIGKHLRRSLLMKLLNTFFFLWILWNFLSFAFYRPPLVAGYENERCLCSTNFFPATKIMSSSNSFSFFQKCLRISNSLEIVKNEAVSPEVFCNGKRCSWKFRKIHMLLPESRFLLKLQNERLQLNWKETLVQEIFCEFYQIPKNISFTENHLATASGNDPGESLVLGGKS